MKRKLLTLFVALTCATGCAAGFAACNDGDNDLLGVILATAENPSDKKNSITAGEFVYGQDADINEALSGVKFYKHFGNNTYAEVAESELTVRYEKDGVTLPSKPVTYTASRNSVKSNYQYTYSIDGATNISTVTFTVDKIKSEAFTAELSKTTWKYGENTASVTLKNPSGTALQVVDDSGYLKEGDVDYNSIGLYAMTKTDYTQAGADAKSYSALTTREDDANSANQGYNKRFGKKLIDFAENDGNYTDQPDGLKQGKYVLIACIDYTHNYREIVCATEFEINAPDSPFGKTFVLDDITAEKMATGEDLPEEVIDMAVNLKEKNTGKTVICATDGKVTGTCDFGFGVFDDLTDNEVLTLTFGKEEDEYSSANPIYVSVKNEEGLTLEGEYRNGTLTLSLQQQTDKEPYVSYFLHFTFKLQTA